MKEGKIEFSLRAGEVRAFLGSITDDAIPSEHHGEALVVVLRKRPGSKDIDVKIRPVSMVERLEQLHDAVMDGTVQTLIAERDSLRAMVEGKALAQIVLIAGDFAKSSLIVGLPEGSHQLLVQGPVRLWNMLIAALAEAGVARVQYPKLAEPDQRPWAQAGSPLEWAKLAIAAMANEQHTQLSMLASYFSQAMQAAQRLALSERSTQQRLLERSKIDERKDG
jgi:hypothetical protein